MTTIAERMREAANQLRNVVVLNEVGQLVADKYLDLVKQLRADADALEAVEREMREWDRNILTVQRYADRIRGEVK